MEKQINLLREIKETPELREKIEELIDSENEKILAARKKDSGKDKSHENEAIDKCASHMAETIRHLCMGYRADPEAGYLYVAMDKKFYPRIRYNREYGESKRLSLFGERFRYNKPWFTHVDGGSLISIYKDGAEEAAKFFEEIHLLLPNSSKKYILSKMGRTAEDFETEVILNEFQKKAFLRELDDKFDERTVQSLFENFQLLRDDDERLLTLYYFYISILEKYPKMPKDKAKKWAKIEEAAISEFNTILTYRLRFIKKERDTNPTLRILTAELKKNPTAREKITKAFLHGYLDVYAEIYLCEVNEEEKTKKQLEKHIGNNLIRGMKFESLPEELQGKLIEEARKQYETNSLL